MFTDELEVILPELRAYARMLCANRDMADDVVQNACLKAWKARKSFDPKRGAFRAWMFTIARNEFLQLIRKQRPVDYCDPAEFEYRLVENCQIETRSACAAAIRALFTLSPEQRDVFILVIAVGYSYEEAAKICKCSVGTIKSRISRARAKLADLIEEMDLPLAESSDQGHDVRSMKDLLLHVDRLTKDAA